MKILYKKILALELWHDYYLGQPTPPQLPEIGYDISDVLALVPTPECLQVLQNLRWVFRPHPHGGSLFARVDETTTEDFQTTIPVDRPYQLTFWLVVRDRNFANFTNLPLIPSRNQIYYFSNLSGNQGHALFLTQPLPNYTANTEYDLGQLVNYNNSTLEALRYQGSTPVIPDQNDWETLPNSQYVSVLDRLPIQGFSRTHTVASANPGDTFRFTLVNVNGVETFALDFTVPKKDHIRGEAIAQALTSQFAVNLNFSEQIPGRYQLFLDGIQIDEFIFFDPAANSNAFGIVEIVLNHDLVPADFKLLESSFGETLIRPRTYVIRFKNRATRWRYKHEKPHNLKLENVPDYLDLINKMSYATKKPVGLLHKPEQLLNNGEINLPVPNVSMIKPETNAEQQVTAIFSDVYMF